MIPSFVQKFRCLFIITIDVGILGQCLEHRGGKIPIFVQHDSHWQHNVFEFKVELEAPLPLCIAKEGGMAHAASIAKCTSLHDGQLP